MEKTNNTSCTGINNDNADPYFPAKKCPGKYQKQVGIFEIGES